MSKKMSKLLLLSAAALSCLTMSISGCFVKGFEKDISIACVKDEQVIKTGSVNIFNNMILPGEQTNANEDPFLGWALTPNYNADTDTLYQPNGVVHYKEMKEAAKMGNVTFYPVFGKLQEADYYVYVAWYDKVATSGIDATLAGQIEADLKSHLSASGVSQADLAKIVFKGHEGDVATSTGSILDDMKTGYFAVVMLGWGSNINTTGVMNADNKVNDAASANGAKFGAKSGRYIQLRTFGEKTVADTDPAKVVFDYLVSKYK